MKIKSNVRRIYRSKKLKDVEVTNGRISKTLTVSTAVVYNYLSETKRLKVRSPIPKKASYVAIAPFREILDPPIKEWFKTPRKKRPYKKALFAELLAKHEKLGAINYNQFCRYMKKSEQLFSAAHGHFLTLEHEPDECQADYAKFYYLDGDGVVCGGYLVALSFPSSGVAYCQAFRGKSREGFLSSMQNIFRHVGGVPREVWFDNDGSIVLLLWHGNRFERILNPQFDAFRSHYNFTPVFTPQNSGNQKGSVEKSIGFLRGNLLVPYPVITDFAEFNRQLLKRCDRLASRPHRRFGYDRLKKFKGDLKSFLPLPKLFACESVYIKKPNSYGRLSVNGKYYYLDSKLADVPLTVKLCSERCRITDANGAVALDTVRLFGSSLQADVDWSLVLPRLAQNPHGFPTLPIVRSFPKAVRLYIATTFPPQLNAFVRNLGEICKMSDLATAASVAESCILNGKLERKDFLRTLREIKKSP